MFKRLSDYGERLRNNKKWQCFQPKRIGGR